MSYQFQFHECGVTYQLSQLGLSYCLFGNQTTFLPASMQDIHRFISQLFEKWSETPDSFYDLFIQHKEALSWINITPNYSCNLIHGLKIQRLQFEINHQTRTYEVQSTEEGRVLYRGCILL